MNRSDGPAADVPPALVTVMSTGPAVPAGDVAVMDVGESTMNVAGAVPKRTAVAPVKAVPAIVTVAPPAVRPELGLTALTIGASV
jgi:hypothetical protein